MFNKLIKKYLNKEVISYIFFGVLTTAVNFVTFFILNSLLHCDENLSNFIAIVFAILFAYITNRKMVFHTTAKGFRENFDEFLKFVSGRAVTMIIEFVSGVVLFKTKIPYMVSKALISVVIVILNFFISKFFAFKKKDNKIEENNEAKVNEK